MIFLGIGNFGKKYTNNRHNIGFTILDYIVKRMNLTYEYQSKHQAEIAIYRYDNKKIYFVKPQTYVNNSGYTIASIKKFYKLDNKDIYVIHDEVEMRFANILINFNNKSRGHNGIRSISNGIGDDYWHIRFGINRPTHDDVARYVLSDFKTEEEEKFKPIFENIFTTIEEIIHGRILDSTERIKF